MHNHKRYTFFIFFFCLLTCFSYFNTLYGQQTNTTQLSSKNIQVPDSQKNVLNKDTTKNNSSQFEAEISYSASDSIVMFGNGTGFLYGNTDIKYKDMDLNEASYVRVKMDSAMVYAKGAPDSLGVIVGKPIFKDKDSEYTSDEIIYNFRTKKGYVKQAVTQQGDGFIISDHTKIIDNNTINLEDGKYTTCDNHVDPHFFLSLSKARVKPGEYGVSGPAHLVLLDVPFPVYLPFSYFPFSTKYSSGIEMPSFDSNSVQGYGLINGGYYFAINDYVDVDLRGDIYTRGTWGVNLTSTYRKRYKYNGGVIINYREDVSGEKDLSDYRKTNSLSIRWSHQQDAKVNPFRTFSASVNFATSGYSKSNINNYYTPSNAEVTKGSSISYSRRFPNNPFSITANFNIEQNMRDSSISLTLPNLAISMSRIYPFKRKVRVGNERWFEKISMSYSGNITNSIRRNEKLILKTPLSDWDNSATHQIPVSATFNLFNAITISPSLSYTERWYLKSTEQSWNEKENKLVTTDKTGFKRVYDYNFGIGANTTLYGMYTPIEKLFGGKIVAIRHKLEPSISFGYNPNFADPRLGYMSSYVKTTVDDNNPAKIYSETVYYSRFKNYSPPGKTGRISFSLNNNLEMKVKNDKDTTGTNPTKIISLIDQFSISGGYNLMADSMKWDMFSTSLRLKFKSYSLNLNGAWDPYMNGVGPDGKTVRRINQLRWNHGKFPRFLGTSLNYSYTFNNETFKKKTKKQADKNSKQGDDKNKDAFKSDSNNPESENSSDISHDGMNNDLAIAETDADGYEKTKIPWSLTVNYSVRYGDGPEFDYKKMEYKRRFMHNLNLSGNLTFTPGWTISANSSYDFEHKQFTYTTFNVTRNLHCWTLTGSFVPFGPYKSYNFRIGVNSSMLKDLKLEKQGNRSGYQNNVNWY